MIAHMKCVSNSIAEKPDSSYWPTFWLHDLKHTKLKKKFYNVLLFQSK